MNLNLGGKKAPHLNRAREEHCCGFVCMHKCIQGNNGIINEVHYLQKKTELSINSDMQV